MRPLSRDRTWRLRAFVNPKFFSMPAPAARFFVDSGMTQRGACRAAAGPNGMRGLILQRSNRPWGAIDCRQPRYPGKNFQGPEVLRPRLTAGLPLSAFGQKAAVHFSKLDRHRQGVLRCVSIQDSSQTCAARAKYRHTHDRNKCEFVAHRRHNSSCACVTGNELKPFQRRAHEISPAPFRLMSHALRTASARKISAVLDAWRCLRGVLGNRGAFTARDVCAERMQKKEAGFPAPLVMTTEVHFLFFLATAITFALSIARCFAPQSRRQ